MSSQNSLELSRSPHGERGLKYSNLCAAESDKLSLPARGAWVEIFQMGLNHCVLHASLPARGAWVEIKKRAEEGEKATVAPRTGSVG